MAGSELLSLMRPRGNSPYSIGGVSPGMINALIQQGGKSELLAEAKSMLPDSTGLAKAIMDRNLFAGDKKKYVSALNRSTSQFMEEYRKSPYHAFTKEARAQISQMKGIANNTDLDAMEQAKKTSDSEYTRATKDGLLSNPLVEQGTVAVIRDGQMRRVPIGQLRQTDTFQTFNSVYQQITKTGSGKIPLTFDMTDWETVQDKLKTAVANMGSEAFEFAIKSDGQNTGLISKNKNQVKAGKERLEWLRKNFTQSEINTIQSEYLKRTGDNSSGADSRALKWMDDLAVRYIQGSMDSSVSTAVSPVEKLKETQAKTKAALASKDLNAPVGFFQGAFINAFQEMTEKINSAKDGSYTGDLTGNMTSNVWEQIGPRIGQSGISRGLSNYSGNPFFNALEADRSASLTLPDGTIIERDNAMPDNTRDIQFKREGNETYAYVPTLYATDETFGNSAFGDSKWVGRWASDGKGGGRYEKEKVGEIGNNGNHHERMYTGVGNALDEERSTDKGTMPSKMVKSEFFGIDDPIYQTIVKVRVPDNIETLVRQLTNLDNNPQYSTKAVESFIPVERFTGGNAEKRSLYELER